MTSISEFPRRRSSSVTYGREAVSTFTDSRMIDSSSSTAGAPSASASLTTRSSSASAAWPQRSTEETASTTCGRYAQSSGEDFITRSTPSRSFATSPTGAVISASPQTSFTTSRS